MFNPYSKHNFVGYVVGNTVIGDDVGIGDDAGIGVGIHVGIKNGAGTNEGHEPIH